MGRQKVDQYPVTPWGTQTYGLTWLPADYASNPNEKYPLIIFLHGSGEGGDGVQGLNNLLIYGLPNKIAAGFNPEAVNPVDGQNYKFIVVSPQAPWSAHWSYAWGSIQWILADVMQRYRVDPKRVYVTGISAGGAGAWSCVTNGYNAAQKFAAVIPVSAAGTNSPNEAAEIPLVGGTYGAKVWNVCGANDSWLAFAQNATNTINSNAPEQSAWLTPIPGAGHDPGAWNTAYDPNFTSNGLNIYQWMLKFKRHGNGNGPGNGNGNGNIAPVANAGPDQTVTLPLNSVQLNGSGTDPDGQISDYSWNKVSGPPGGNISNNDIRNPHITNLHAGTYVYRLTVRDNGGNNGNGNGNSLTATDEVSIIVNPPAPLNYAAIPSRIQAENYSSMEGVQTENTSDAGGGQNVGWIDEDDWMKYPVNVTTSGNYTVKFRVATPRSGAKFKLLDADGDVLTSRNVPNTGGWQNWETITVQIPLSAGNKILKLISTEDEGWNINWIEFELPQPNQAPTANAGAAQSITLPVNSVQLTGVGNDADGIIASHHWSQVNGPSNANIQSPSQGATQINSLSAGSYTFRYKVTDDDGASATSDVTITVHPAAAPPPSNSQRIEAENYSHMHGVQKETTLDAGGGLNVGGQDNGDWMDYSIQVPTAGSYLVNFRIATMVAGAQFQMKKADGSVLATVNVPSTGTYQSWQTISANVTLSAGQQTVRIHTISSPAGWNLNWMELQPSAAVVTPPASMRIEAENWTSMQGVQKEATQDAGGGWNVGGQDNGDWMDYTINMTNAGNFQMNFRIATMVSGANFQVKKADGSVLATVHVPSTGAYQAWQTISTNVALAAGQQTIRIQTLSSPGGWNLNWLEIAGASAPVQPTSRIQGEDFISMSGVQNEPTQDAGGGLNLGYQDFNDWADYQVNMPAAGTYTVNFRIATMVAGARFQVKKSDGSVLATVNVPSTGAYQAWQTISTELHLEAGAQTLRLHTIASPGGWNLNWFEFIPAGTSAARVAVSTEERTTPGANTASLAVYPNPVADRLMIQVNSEETGEMKVEFFNISGSVQKTARLPKAEKGTSQNYLSLGELPKGTYMVRVTVGKFTKTQKLIKL